MLFSRPPPTFTISRLQQPGRKPSSKRKHTTHSATIDHARTYKLAQDHDDNGFPFPPLHPSQVPKVQATSIHPHPSSLHSNCPRLAHRPYNPVHPIKWISLTAGVSKNQDRKRATSATVLLKEARHIYLCCFERSPVSKGRSNKVPNRRSSGAGRPKRPSRPVLRGSWEGAEGGEKEGGGEGSYRAAVASASLTAAARARASTSASRPARQARQLLVLLHIHTPAAGRLGGVRLKDGGIWETDIVMICLLGGLKWCLCVCYEGDG